MPRSSHALCTSRPVHSGKFLMSVGSNPSNSILKVLGSEARTHQDMASDKRWRIEGEEDGDGFTRSFVIVIL